MLLVLVCGVTSVLGVDIKNQIEKRKEKTDKTLSSVKMPGSLTKVIRPNDRLREGAFSALRYLLEEIWLFRGHIWTVFSQDFRNSYYGSGLGVLWNYILPIVPITVYMLLGAIGVVPDFDGVDGTTYRAFGITVWFLLAGCVQLPIQTVQSRNKEVMKTSFPLSAAIASSFGKLIFDTLVRTVFVIAVMTVMMSWPVWSAILLPLLLLPAIILFIGIGLLLGILNAIYKDVSRVTTILLTYGIFVSGVIFPLPNHPVFTFFNMINPFAVFIDASRAIVFEGVFDQPLVFLVMSVLAIGVFLLACRIFYVMEYRVRGIT